MTTEDDDMMAYVDGELSPAKLEAFEARLARDPQLRRAVEQERLLRRKFAETYDAALTEELPPRLVGLLDRPVASVLPFRRPGTAPARWRWQQLTAMAASLALVVLVTARLSGPSEDAGAGYSIAGETAEALDVQLASTQDPSAPVQIGVSFTGADGRPCRTFEVSEGAGLACRAGGEWQLERFATGGGSPGGEYRRAASAAAEIMRDVQELVAGEPMNAEQERRARDSGWPAGE